MSVEANSSLGPGSTLDYQIGSSPVAGSSSLQPTQSVQNSNSGQVLGASTAINQVDPNAELTVEFGGSNQAALTTETTPVQPSSFNVPPVLIYVAIGLVIAAAISFVWSQRGDMNRL